ncbi:CpaF family protein, partial [Mycobacterium tuberculosis]
MEADTTERPGGQAVEQAVSPYASDAYKLLKERMHLRLLERFDLAALETLKPDVLRQEISTMTTRLLQEEPEALNDIERRTLIR